MLRPDIPEDGMPKGGTPASRVGSRLKSAGEAAGIDFTGRTDRTPRTELFHATMKVILDEQGSKKQTRFQEVVFDQYFTKGIFPNQQALLAAAERIHLKDTVETFFADTAKVKKIRHDVSRQATEASQRGIDGVPYFEFNNHPAFSGAQDVTTLAAYLNKHAKQSTEN